MRTPVSVVKNNFQWYILRVEGAYEYKAALALQAYGAAGAIPDFYLVKQLWVPEVPTATKKRATLLPGYLFINALLSTKLYSSLKKPDFPHIFGWVQCKGSWPSTVSEEEMNYLFSLEDPTSKQSANTFNVGDKIYIPGLNMTGIVMGLATDFIYLSITMFHKTFVVKFDWQHLKEAVLVH